MEFLVVLLLIVVIAALIPKSQDLHSIDSQSTLVVQKKSCPPHQWFWQDIVDQNGVKQGERIVCKVCGPISNRKNDEGRT